MGARAVLGKGAPTPSWLWRRAFDTLMRYRGSALAEFSRPLRLPQAMRNARAIQDEARTIQEPPRMRNEPETRGHADIGQSRGSTPPVHDRATIAPIGAMRNGPEARENPGDGRAQGCEPAQAPPGRASARSGTSAWLRCRPAPAPDDTGPPGASGS
jgi:hypothetical protein